MKFPYKRLKEGVDRPIIPIEVGHDDKAVRYFALIDSGADASIFQAEIAELLGLELEKGTRRTVAGVVEGETRPYYIHNVSLKVGGWQYDDVPVGFMPDLSKSGHGLLGEDGFFDLFVVKFNFPKREIELKEVRR